MEAVAADIVEGLAGGLLLFCAVLAGSALPADVIALGQLFLDLGQVLFVEGDVQGVGDGFQMHDLLFDFLGGSDTITLTHEQIARYMGSAREVVSRMLKYFANEGIVEVSRKGIRILDKKRLRKQCL